MSITKGLWTLNALATEFDLDRRTVAKRISYIPYVRCDGKSKQWLLADVARSLAPDLPLPRVEQPIGSPLTEAMTLRLEKWRDIHGNKPKIEATVEELAHLIGCNTETVVKRLRAGMPYKIEGSWDNGDGFAISVAHAIEWSAFAAVIIHLSDETDLAEELGFK